MGNSATKHYDDNLYLTPKEGVSFEEKIVEINGDRRNRCQWTPTDQKPKGLILIAHGLHEHSLRYCEFAHELCRRGFAVMAIDHKGHGMSEGTKGLISDFHVLEHDFVAFAKAATLEFPNVPCSLFAHSMGTLVASLALVELSFVKCVCFSGCCINAGPAAASPFGVSCLYPLSQTSAAVHLTAVMASIAPTGAAAPLLMDAITKDEEEKQIMLKDRRRFEGDIMNKSAYEVLKMIDAVKVVLPKINIPAHCVHGANDMVAMPSGSEYLYTHLGTPEGKKSIQVYPGQLHELFHEDLINRTKAINDVADYLVKHTTL